MIREACRVLYGRRRRKFGRRAIPMRTPAEIAYETWEHDYEILLCAVMRTPGLDLSKPSAIAQEAAAAADMMKRVVDDHHPNKMGVRWYKLRGVGGARRLWLQWQELFDKFVHELADSSTMTGQEIILRSQDLADEVMRVIEERRPSRESRSRRETAPAEAAA